MGDNELNAAIEVAQGKYFAELDQLLPDGMLSDEWLPIVENCTGEIEGYREHIDETWEDRFDLHGVAL
ncbi:hypothetical protein [Cryobacterium sp. Y11]|uniref:hypothetical protein n=1 Tax=Cryobacterium sp. Y11 TaxID=2045016 RepID=UPI000CE54339|nr:hypothetical protein [Cryobacterium sp. Y11]